MHTWQTASTIFFAYIGAVGLLAPRLNTRKRWLVLGGAAAGSVIALGAGSPAHPVLNDWILPPAALLIAYWTSGLLFVAPMPRAERLLLGLDRRLRIRCLASAAPRALAELLEVAYAAVYPVIPAALIVYLVAMDAPDASRFWAVILITDYICFGMLPWIQTRPPRAIEPGDPWNARFRVVNLRLLGKTSIHVNTFPSGHAAEALAAPLLILGAPLPIVAAMFAVALAISAGAVLGRYHYTADALSGWAVAVGVWLLLKG